MFSEWNIRIWDYTFISPQWLWLLLGIPLYWIYYILSGKVRKEDVIFVFVADEQTKQEQTTVRYVKYFQQLLLTAVSSLLIIAIAKPYLTSKKEEEIIENNLGIDIMIAMDISVSMLARDFSPNRLEVSKKVAKQFIDNRRGDRIGLVVYEGEALTICPSTFDYEIIKSGIDKLEPGKLAPGTAIGLGLGTAVTRIAEDTLSSKVIILLTDGVNMQTDITPIEAAKLARHEGIKVYTIGVGTTGVALYPEQTEFGIRYVESEVEIDEALLKEIAQVTGGKYFRATDENSLKEIYDEIGKLEKKEIRNPQFYDASLVSFLPFINWTFLLLLIYWLIQLFYFKRYA